MISSTSAPVEQASEWAEVLAAHLPNVEVLVTEDGTPVETIFSETHQRLLVASLYRAWAGPGAGRPFLALAHVGLLYAVHRRAPRVCHQYVE